MATLGVTLFCDDGDLEKSLVIIVVRADFPSSPLSGS